jgi:SAM-dependent methyltransferase
VFDRSLRIPDNLSLPGATQSHLGSLRLDLAPDDGMYHGNDGHYLSCGASALNVMLAALQLANVQAPKSILDFGAGAGRVTRWLRAAFPVASISACDLREQDMSFCRSVFLADTWISGIDIDELNSPRKYDIIWVGSVLTHLSADNSVKLIRKLLCWLNAGGLLVASTHGRFALTRQDGGHFTYLHSEGWDSIKIEYATTGYGYFNYVNQIGYGISLTKLSWLSNVIDKMPDVRLVALAEKAWDDHHDVIAIQNIPISN